ncbi:hypothetical protein MKX01_040841 [Papaver californicum]|nr:hypothetical protein MKX01_040841 [Papaver californicum]
MDHPEDESRVLGKQDDEENVARLEEFKKSMEAKMTLRQSNLNPERPDTGFLWTLDSSIKRNTAVIKKLKQINEEQKEGMMEELRHVNLSNFVSEAVTAICDAKLRTSDIQAAVQICSLLHQRYKEFCPSLVQGLLKIFSSGKSRDKLDADKSSKAMKKTSDHFNDRDATSTNLSHLASFARQARVFLGLSLSGQEFQEEFFKDLNVTADQKKIFKKTIYAYYDVAAELLQSEHAFLRQSEHENAKFLNAKGELSEENATLYEKQRKSYDHLFCGVSFLAEALDMQPPMMPEDHTIRVTTGDDTSSPASGKESSALEPMWDDEVTRAFYECLLDLRAFVPAVLLGESETKEPEQSAKSQEQPTDLHLNQSNLPWLYKKPQRARLPGCVSRDLIDHLTVEFCYLNSKSNRKRLVRALFNVPRTSLELLPYYSRLVATLAACMKDISSMLLAMLEEEFNFLINKFIRKLLFSDLNKSSIEHVLRQLRKLPWSECETYLLKCFLKVHKGKYSQFGLIASLTACLSRYHDEFAVAVVDEVLEEIRLGLEVNDYGMQQRRIAHMRFMRNLCNYELVDSSVIFETLLLILNFGHGTPEQNIMDPPEDWFRVWMIITLLHACGHFFSRKLDRFLTYFQRYILSKVNAALIDLEEHECKGSTDKTNNGKLRRTTSASISANEKGEANGVEENGKGHEDEGNSESDTGSEVESYEDKSENQDEGSDSDVESGPAASDEDEVQVRQKVIKVDPEEEVDFDREFKALMQESLESRKLEMRSRPTMNMVIPMNMFEGSTKDHHHGRGSEGENSGEDTMDEEGGGKKEVRVKVLVKRGNKQQTKQMFIPKDCSLSLKKIILEYNDIEEEEMNGVGPQTTNWVQTGVSRPMSGRGSTWEGSGGRGGGVRYRHHTYSSCGDGGFYYGRRR